MSTAIAERLYTCDEFDALPNPDDGRKMELVDGRVVYSGVIGRTHGRVTTATATWLYNFVRHRDLGEMLISTGFRLRDGSRLPNWVLGPDVSFVRLSRVPPRHGSRTGSLHFAPDLAVEVIQLKDTENKLGARVSAYFQAATPIVWVVRPRSKTVEVLTLDGRRAEFRLGDTLTSAEAGFEVEGFTLPLSEVFR